MADLLNDDFQVNHRVHFKHALPGKKGNVVAVLRCPLDPESKPDAELTDENSVSCEVHLYGATVTSFKEKSFEHFYMSPDSALDGSKPIRGGIPICWPQFSDMGNIIKHGFARRNVWRVSSARASKLADGDDCTKLTLTLDTAQVTEGKDSSTWPHTAELTYVITLSARPATLTMALTVENVGSDAFSFTTALHTYYRVGDCTQILIPHMKGVHYLDNADDRKEKVEEEPILSMEKEVDRVYMAPPYPLLLRDPGRRREITIRTTNLPDAVVWNPWVERSKTFTDFPADGYKEMVCIESAAIKDAPRLPPGKSWKAEMTLVGQNKR